MTIRLKHTMLYPKCEQTLHYNSFSEHFCEGITIGEINNSNELCLLFLDTSKAIKDVHLTSGEIFRKVQCEDALGFLLYDVILVSVYLLDICEQMSIHELCIQKDCLFNRIITSVLSHEGIIVLDHITSYRLTFDQSGLEYCITDLNNNNMFSFCVQNIISLDQYVYSDLFEYADKISREFDYEQFVSYYVHKENSTKVINTLNERERSIVLDW